MEGVCGGARKGKKERLRVGGEHAMELVPFPSLHSMLRPISLCRMCLPQPIDIVYTWVNGSDPVLLKNLAALKLRLEVCVYIYVCV